MIIYGIYERKVPFRALMRVAGPEADVSALISRIDGVDNVASMGEREPGVCEFAVEVREGADIRRDLFDRLASRKWPLMGLKSMEMTLEDIFIALTRERVPQGIRGGKKK